MVEHREYDAFGAIDQVFGEAGAAATSADLQSDFGFAGRNWDDEAGLYYNRARWYEPQSGRFIGEDPAQDGSNWYAYAGNDPVNFVDPTGLAVQSPLNGLFGPSNSFGINSGPISFPSSPSNSFGLNANTLAGSSSFDVGSISTRAPNDSSFGPASFDVSGFNSSLNKINLDATARAINTTTPRISAQPSSAFERAFSLAIDVGAGIGSGLKTGGKALFNAGADTAVGLATLGFKESPIRFTPTQTDIANGFGASNLIARGGTELATGLLTGGASQLGRIGKAVTVLDVAGNAVAAGRGAIGVAQNGVTLENSVQLVGGGLGLGGNVATGGRALRELAEEASSFRLQFDPATLSSGPIPLGGVSITRVASGSPTAVRRGFGNIGSHGPVDPTTALSGADKFLGAGYKEIAPGVFRSADGLRQFRMTPRDLLPTHGNIGPHVHFEIPNPSGGPPLENLHLPITP